MISINWYSLRGARRMWRIMCAGLDAQNGTDRFSPS